MLVDDGSQRNSAKVGFQSTERVPPLLFIGNNNTAGGDLIVLVAPPAARTHSSTAPHVAPAAWGNWPASSSATALVSWACNARCHNCLLKGLQCNITTEPSILDELSKQTKNIYRGVILSLKHMQSSFLSFAHLWQTLLQYKFILDKWLQYACAWSTIQGRWVGTSNKGLSCEEIILSSPICNVFIPQWPCEWERK